MTNKRKVYNQLTGKPKTPKTIGKAVGLDPVRAAAILQQLVKEGKAVHRTAGYVKGTGVPPPPAPPPTRPPPSPPSTSPVPAPSWTLPSPLILSGVYGDTGHALDPATGQPRAGVGTIGNILVPGVCPLWECHPVHGTGRGLLGQIEGFDQLQAALDLINQHRRDGDHLAIVGTGNVAAKRMIDAGVTVAFYELNAQPPAGWEPYGNWNAIRFQAHQDGWVHCHPSWGVYGSVGLRQYADYHAGVYNAAGQLVGHEPVPQGLTGYFAVFSGQGMGDTGSWPYLA